MTRELLNCSNHSKNNSPNSNNITENHQGEESYDASSIALPIEERWMSNSLNTDPSSSTTQIFSNPFNGATHWSSNLETDFNHENITPEIMMDFVDCYATDTASANYFTGDMSSSSSEFANENEGYTVGHGVDVPNETCSSGYFSESQSELECMDTVSSDPFLQCNLKNNYQNLNTYDKSINKSNIFEAYDNEDISGIFQTNKLQDEISNVFRGNATGRSINYVNPFAEFKGFYPRVNRNAYEHITVENTSKREQDLVSKDRDKNSTIQRFENDFSKYPEGLFQSVDQNPNNCETNISSENSKTIPLLLKRKQFHTKNENSLKLDDQLSIFEHDKNEQVASGESDFLVELTRKCFTNDSNDIFQKDSRTFENVKLVDYPLSPVYHDLLKISKNVHASESKMSLLQDDATLNNCHEIFPFIEQNLNSILNEFEENLDFQNQQNDSKNILHPYIAYDTKPERTISPRMFDTMRKVDQIPKECDNELDTELNTKNTTEAPVDMLNRNISAYPIKNPVMYDHEILLNIVKSYFTSCGTLGPYEEQELSIETTSADDGNQPSETTHIFQNKSKDISKGLKNDHNYFNRSDSTKACYNEKSYEIFDEMHNASLFPFREPLLSDLKCINDSTNTAYNNIGKEIQTESVESVSSFQKVDERNQNELPMTDINKTIFPGIDSRSVLTGSFVANLNNQSKSFETESLKLDAHQKSPINCVKNSEMSNTLGESDELIAAEVVKTELGGIEDSNFFGEQSPVVGDIFDFLKRLDSCIDFNAFDNIFSTQINTLNSYTEFQGESPRHSMEGLTSSHTKCIHAMRGPPHHQKTEPKFHNDEGEKEQSQTKKGIKQSETNRTSKDEQLRSYIHNTQQTESSDNQKTDRYSRFSLLHPTITNYLKSPNKEAWHDSPFYNPSSSDKGEIAVEQSTLKVRNVQFSCDSLEIKKNDLKEGCCTANITESFKEFSGSPDCKNGKEKEHKCADLPKFNKGIQSIKWIVPREYQNPQVKNHNIDTERREKNGLCPKSFPGSGTKANSKDGRGSVISYFSKAAGLISAASSSNQKFETDNPVGIRYGFKKTDDVRQTCSRTETRPNMENQLKPVFFQKITENIERHSESMLKVCSNTDPRSRNVSQQPNSKRQCLTPDFGNPNSTLLSSESNVVKNLESERIPSQNVEVSKIVDNYTAKFHNSTENYASPVNQSQFGPKQFCTKAVRIQSLTSNALKSGLEQRDTNRRTLRSKTTIAKCTLSAVQELNNGEGSTVFDIMGYVRNQVPPDNTNVSHNVRKTLKDAAGAGSIELKSGKYLVSLNSTSTQSSMPKSGKKKLNYSIESSCNVKSKKNPTPKVTQPKRTKSVRLCKKSDDKTKGDPCL